MGIVIVPPPAEGQIDNRTGRSDGIEGLQGFQDDGALLPDVPRFAQRVAKWPTQEHGAWRPYFFSEFPHDRYADGGNAGFFNLSLDQSHGLIADASGGGQQDDVDLIQPEFFRHLFCRAADQGDNVFTVNMAHEGIVRVGKPANQALLL